jgi:hypothetical protein
LFLLEGTRTAIVIFVSVGGVHATLADNTSGIRLKEGNRHQQAEAGLQMAYIDDLLARFLKTLVNGVEILSSVEILVQNRKQLHRSPSMQVVRPEYLFSERQHLEKGSFHLSMEAVNMAIGDPNLDVRDGLGMLGSRPIIRPTKQYSCEGFFGLLWPMFEGW